MYFQPVIGDPAYCDKHILSFQPLLTNLSQVSTTPNFSWLTPDLCMDGHDHPCVNGDPGGLTEIDAFLQIWVPTIMASPAYKANGLILITFDGGTTHGSCCETSGYSRSHPNTTEPGLGGPGAGRVGAILLSPFINPGTVSSVNYNHYSTLKSIEGIFGLTHLGDAAMAQVKPFGADVYSNPEPIAPHLPRASHSKRQPHENASGLSVSVIWSILNMSTARKLDPGGTT